MPYYLNDKNNIKALMNRHVSFTGRRLNTYHFVHS